MCSSISFVILSPFVVHEIVIVWCMSYLMLWLKMSAWPYRQYNKIKMKFTLTTWGHERELIQHDSRTLLLKTTSLKPGLFVNRLKAQLAHWVFILFILRILILSVYILFQRPLHTCIENMKLIISAWVVLFIVSPYHHPTPPDDLQRSESFATNNYFAWNHPELSCSFTYGRIKKYTLWNIQIWLYVINISLVVEVMAFICIS